MVIPTIFVGLFYERGKKVGYIKHNTIVVTGFKPDIQEAYKKAVRIFDWRQVTKVSHEMSNGYHSFSILNKGYRLIYPKRLFGFAVIPDGSKEGWETSNDGDDNREKFFNWLKKKVRMLDAVDVRFGGDDDDVMVEDGYEGL